MKICSHKIIFLTKTYLEYLEHIIFFIQMLYYEANMSKMNKKISPISWVKNRQWRATNSCQVPFLTSAFLTSIYQHIKLYSTKNDVTMHCREMVLTIGENWVHTSIPFRHLSTKWESNNRGLCSILFLLI